MSHRTSKQAIKESSGTKPMWRKTEENRMSASANSSLPAHDLRACIDRLSDEACDKRTAEMECLSEGHDGCVECYGGCTC